MTNGVLNHQDSVYTGHSALKLRLICVFFALCGESNLRSDEGGLKDPAARGELPGHRAEAPGDRKVGPITSQKPTLSPNHISVNHSLAQSHLNKPLSRPITNQQQPGMWGGAS